MVNKKVKSLFDPSRPTIGQLAYDISQQTPETFDPVEVERAYNDEQYVKKVREAIEKGQKELNKDFYLVRTLKKERLMHNVIRDYLNIDNCCPTPTYDQTVYKYHKEGDTLELLWSIPAKDICETMRNFPIEAQKSNTFKYVMDLYDNTLLKYCKRLNGEADDSNIIINKEKKINILVA